MKQLVLVQLLMAAVTLNAARIMDSEIAAKMWSKGCTYNGKVFKEGTGIATKEPCLNCTCHRGAVRCHLQVCPHLHDPTPPPPGCVLVERKGACCPKLYCPEKEGPARVERKDPSGKLSTWKMHTDLRRILTKQLSRSASDKSGCVEGGTLYADGSAMMTSSSCEYCFCLRGKQLCVKPRCAPPMAGCAPRYRALACCPTHYDCSTETAATFNGTTATVHLEKISASHVIGHSGDLILDDTSLAMRANDRLIDLPRRESRKENSRKVHKKLRLKRQAEEDVSEAATTEHSEASDNTETNSAADSMTEENAGNDNKEMEAEVSNNDQKEATIITSTDLQDRPILLSISPKDTVEVQVSSSVSTGEEPIKAAKLEPQKADSGKILDALLNLKGKPKEATKTESKTTITVSSSSSSSSSISSKVSSSSIATSSESVISSTKMPEETAVISKLPDTTAFVPGKMEDEVFVPAKIEPETLVPAKIEDEDKFHFKTGTHTESVKEVEAFSPTSPSGNFMPIKTDNDEPKNQDFEDFVYPERELPPSLPNIKIFSFGPADAVTHPIDNHDEDERLQIPGVPEQRSPISQISTITGEPSTERPAPVFTATDKLKATSSPLLAFTVTFPPRISSTNSPLELVTRPPTTTSTTATTTTTTKRARPVGNNLAKLSSSSGNFVKIEGCNIYGVMYSVGRIIEELSVPCIECRCTESGVQCTPLKC